MEEAPRFQYKWAKTVDVNWENYTESEAMAQMVGQCATSLIDFRDRYIYPKRRLLFVHRLYYAGLPMRIATKLGTDFYERSQDALNIIDQLKKKGFEEADLHPTRYEETHPLPFPPAGTYKRPRTAPQQKILFFTPWYRDQQHVSNKSNDKEVIEKERKRLKDKEQERIAAAEREKEELRQKQLASDHLDGLNHTGKWEGGIYKSDGHELQVSIYRYHIETKKFEKEDQKGKIKAGRVASGGLSILQLTGNGLGGQDGNNLVIRGPLKTEEELSQAKRKVRTQALFRYHADAFNKRSKRKKILFCETVIVELSQEQGKPQFIAVATQKEDLVANLTGGNRLIHKGETEESLLGAFQHYLYLRIGQELIIGTAIGRIEPQGISIVSSEAITIDVEFWAGQEDSERTNNIVMEFVKNHRCEDACFDTRAAFSTIMHNELVDQSTQQIGAINNLRSVLVDGKPIDYKEQDNQSKNEEGQEQTQQQQQKDSNQENEEQKKKNLLGSALIKFMKAFRTVEDVLKTKEIVNKQIMQYVVDRIEQEVVQAEEILKQSNDTKHELQEQWIVLSEKAQIEYEQKLAEATQIAKQEAEERAEQEYQQALAEQLQRQQQQQEQPIQEPEIIKQQPHWDIPNIPQPTQINSIGLLIGLINVLGVSVERRENGVFLCELGSGYQTGRAIAQALNTIGSIDKYSFWRASRALAVIGAVDANSLNSFVESDGVIILAQGITAHSDKLENQLLFEQLYKESSQEEGKQIKNKKQPENDGFKKVEIEELRLKRGGSIIAPAIKVLCSLIYGAENRWKLKDVIFQSGTEGNSKILKSIIRLLQKGAEGLQKKKKLDQGETQGNEQNQEQQSNSEQVKDGNQTENEAKDYEVLPTVLKSTMLLINRLCVEQDFATSFAEVKIEGNNSEEDSIIKLLLNIFDESIGGDKRYEQVKDSSKNKLFDEDQQEQEGQDIDNERCDCELVARRALVVLGRIISRGGPIAQKSAIEAGLLQQSVIFAKRWWGIEDKIFLVEGCVSIIAGLAHIDSSGWQLLGGRSRFANLNQSLGQGQGKSASEKNQSLQKAKPVTQVKKIVKKKKPALNSASGVESKEQSGFFGKDIIQFTSDILEKQFDNGILIGLCIIGEEDEIESNSQQGRQISDDQSFAEATERRHALLECVLQTKLPTLLLRVISEYRGLQNGRHWRASALASEVMRGLIVSIGLGRRRGAWEVMAPNIVDQIIREETEVSVIAKDSSLSIIRALCVASDLGSRVGDGTGRGAREVLRKESAEQRIAEELWRNAELVRIYTRHALETALTLVRGDAI
ncbi:MAG: hypothetical protein EZS28_020338, partial [Streblomastix strix]